MVVTAVMIQVKADAINSFLDATVKNHEGALKEPGNLRFDVLQDKDDPCRFMLYEVYESEDAALAHKLTSHYLKWKETVKDWMEKPREGIPYTVVRPLDRKKWK